MIFLLLGTFYISLCCWTLGRCFLQRCRHNRRWQESISAHLLAGLCCYSFIAGCWTLILPTGTDLQHLLLIGFTAGYWWLRKPWNALRMQLRRLSAMSKTDAAVVITTAVMLLLMASWKITHPDTLGYHAEIMAWIDAYKAIPGLANLQLRLGYQGQWYPLCSFIFPHLAGADYTNLLNFSLCCWFLLFVSERLTCAERYLHKIVWLLLLLITTTSYTQLRLTATSASPDFIATMLGWWVIYELFSFCHCFREKLMITLVVITAISFKLSVAFIGLIIAGWFAYYLYSKMWRKAALLVFLGIGLMLPFLTRNIITTGYLAFPLPHSAFTSLSWTVPIPTAALDQQYIRAYARARVEYEPKIIRQKNEQAIMEWGPHWWAFQSAADKIILIFSVLGMGWGIIRSKSRWQQNLRQVCILAMLTAGFLFWMYQAPDPRFGFVYIVPLVAFLVPTRGLEKSSAGKLPYFFMLLIMLSTGFLYTGYRLRQYFVSGQILFPLGINNPDAVVEYCKGIQWIKPLNGNNCGGLKAPCLQHQCASVILRGHEVEEGFLPK